MKLKSKILVLAFLLLSGFVALGWQSDFFRAALFGGGTESGSTLAAGMFIPNDFHGAPGQSGEITVKSTTAQNGLLALSFTLSWDPDQIRFLDISDLGTVLQGQNFVIEKTVDVHRGTARITAVKASEGPAVPANAPLLRIGFQIYDTLEEGDIIPLELSAGEMVFAGAANELAPQTVTVRGGRILVDSSAREENASFEEILADQELLASAEKVFLSAPQNLPGVIGLSFTLEWNPNEATFLQAVLADTVFAGKNYFLQSFLEAPGKLQVVMVGSGSGENVSSGTGLAHLLIELDEDLAPQSEVKFTFRNITVIRNDLSEVALPNQEKTLRVETAGTLQLLGSRTLSSTALELEFSDFIAAADLSAVTISPNLLTTTTTLRRDGKKVVLENLTPQTPQTLYRVRVQGNISGNAQGAIDPQFAHDFFHGFSVGAADFRLQSIAVLAADSLDVVFSQNIQSEITPLDLEIWSVVNSTAQKLTVVEVTKSGNKLTLKTAAQTPGTKYTFLAKRPAFRTSQGQLLGPESSRSFFGFTAVQPRILNIIPTDIINDIPREVTISGEDLPVSGEATVKGVAAPVLSRSAERWVIRVPAGIPSGEAEVQIQSSDGEFITAVQKILIHEPAPEFQILSAESFASPVRVQRGEKTTLWVRVQDEIDLSNMDKVTADLRLLEGAAAARFTPGTIVDLKQWYSLEVTIPDSVKIAEEDPYKIPVTAQRKSGEIAMGTISLFVVRESAGSNPPRIEQASVNRPNVPPGSTTPFRFTVVASDPDGAETITQAVIDLTAIGLGPTVLTKLVNDEDDVAPARNCTANDYVLGDWSACTNSTQTRTVEKKAGVECREDAATKPPTSRSCTTSFLKNLFLWPRAAAQSAGLTAWFRSDEFTLPQNITPGTYQLPVTVVDDSGQEARGTVSFSVGQAGGSAPRLEKEDITFSPSKSLKRDAKTKYTITLQTTDENGGNTIESAVADLSAIGLPPTAMTKGAVVGNTAYFSTEFTIPLEVSLGHGDVEITVADNEGNADMARVTVEVIKPTDDPQGHDPKVLSDRGHMTPNGVPNDGKTRFTLFAFVSDREGSENISHVSVELRNVARFVGKTSKPFNPLEDFEDEDDDTSEDAEEDDANGQNCVTTPTIVCLFPSVTEGAEGRWFYLPDLVILPTTPLPQNGEPYLLKVVATDRSGRSSEGIAKVFVSADPLLGEREIEPFLKLAAAVSTNEVEAVFSAPIDRAKITAAAFQIVNSENISEILPIRNLEIASDGRLVRLRTTSMSPITYTLIADPKKLGLEYTKFSSDRVNFEGFSTEKSRNSRPPIALKAEAIGLNSVKIDFSEPLKPSALDAVKFQSSEKADLSAVLHIKGATFGRDTKTVLLTTSLQKMGVEYALRINNVESVFGKKMPEKFMNFRGFSGNKEIYIRLWNQADLNSDGKVDFLDFTLFSAVYGSQEENAPGDLNQDGLVNFMDFTAFAALYGTLPPPPSDDPEEDEFTNEDTDEEEEILNSQFDLDLLTDFQDEQENQDLSPAPFPQS